MEELPVEGVGEDDAVVGGRLRPRARPEEGVGAGTVVRKVPNLDPPLAEGVNLEKQAEFSFQYSRNLNSNRLHHPTSAGLTPKNVVIGR